MEKFNADWNKRLPKEIGKNILETGKRLGIGGCKNSCYWSGYEKDGKYYISLNDECDVIWETSYDDMLDYCL